ncbi:MAG: NADH-quinone oxidoreductase subunit NuoH [Armatimonadota bacterium]
MEQALQQWLVGLGVPLGVYSWGKMLLVAAVVAFGFISLTALWLIYLERKVSGHIQDRLGPMRAGPKGLIQTVYDALKLLMKEDIIPRQADRLLFTLAPIAILAISVVVFVTMPFGRNLIPADLNLGIVFMVAFSSLTVLAIVIAGWSSNNKWSLLGGLRGGAQMLSYEIPMGLAVVTVVMATGSFKISDIIAAQADHWNIWRYPVMGLIAFLVYLTAAVAEVNRGPFDIPEAESELVAGFHTEYTGMKFALFFVSEYANTFIVCAIAATLFLGGWNLPFAGLMAERWPTLRPLLESVPLSVLLFFVKTYALILLVMWVRWTYPRLRVDQLMGFGWKFLIPVGFANLMLMGIAMVLTH